MMNLYPLLFQGIGVLTADPTDPDVVYAATTSLSGGGLFKTQDGGQSWTQLSGDAINVLLTLSAETQETIMQGVQWDDVLDNVRAFIAERDRHAASGGNRCRVTFQLTGGGKILGVSNGNPADHDTDRADNRNTFHGHCIAVVQGASQPAELQLTATSPSLASGSVTFHNR